MKEGSTCSWWMVAAITCHNPHKDTYQNMYYVTYTNNLLTFSNSSKRKDVKIPVIDILWIILRRGMLTHWNTINILWRRHLSTLWSYIGHEDNKALPLDSWRIITTHQPPRFPSHPIFSSHHYRWMCWGQRFIAVIMAIKALQVSLVGQAHNPTSTPTQIHHCPGTLSWYNTSAITCMQEFKSLCCILVMQKEA